MNSGIERQYRVLVAFEGWHVGDTFTTTPTIRLSALVASGYLAQVILDPAELPTVAAQKKLAAALPTPKQTAPKRGAGRRAPGGKGRASDTGFIDEAAVSDFGDYSHGYSGSHDSGSGSSSDPGSSSSGAGGE